MSGFKQIVEGSVTIDHHSGASLIEITITQKIPKDELGNMETVTTSMILEYDEFSDLKKATSLTDDWL